MTEQFIQKTSNRHIALKVCTVLGLLSLGLAATALPVAADGTRPPPDGATSTASPPATGIAVPPVLPPTIDPSLWKISQAQAIRIASAYLTPEALAKAKIDSYGSSWGSRTGESYHAWVVTFMGVTLTQADLDCGAPAAVKPSPDAPYDTLTVYIDAESGTLLSKTAMASAAQTVPAITPIFLGPPVPLPTTMPMPGATPTPALPPDGAGNGASGYAGSGTAAPATQVGGTTTCVVNPLPPPGTLQYGEGDKAADATVIMAPTVATPDAGTPVYSWLMAGTGVLLLGATGGLVALAHARSKRRDL